MTFDGWNFGLRNGILRMALPMWVAFYLAALISLSLRSNAQTCSSDFQLQVESYQSQLHSIYVERHDLREEYTFLFVQFTLNGTSRYPDFSKARSSKDPNSDPTFYPEEEEKEEEEEEGDEKKEVEIDHLGEKRTNNQANFPSILDHMICGNGDGEPGDGGNIFPVVNSSYLDIPSCMDSSFDAVSNASLISRIVCSAPKQFVPRLLLSDFYPHKLLASTTNLFHSNYNEVITYVLLTSMSFRVPDPQTLGFLADEEYTILQNDDLLGCQFHFAECATWKRSNPTMKVTEGPFSVLSRRPLNSQQEASLSTSTPMTELKPLQKSDAANLIAIARRSMNSICPNCHIDDIDSDIMAAIQTKTRLAGLTRSEFQTLFASPIQDAVKGVVKQLVEPVVKLISNLVGGALTDTLASDLGQGVDAKLTDELVQKLVPQTTGILTENMEPNLQESLSSSIEDAVPRDVDQYIRPAIVQDVAPRLREPLTESLSRAVANQTETAISEQVALSLLSPLVHMLTRSLTHSIAPALTSALSRSPTMDYMCMACSREGGDVCKRCHSSTVSTYYTSFYSGVFSSYYADYYGNYYYNYYRDMIETPPGGSETEEPRQSDDSQQSEHSQALRSGTGNSPIPPVYPSSADTF